MSRGSLFGRTFLAMVAVALAAILATGLIARRALETAFEDYLISLGVHMGPGAGAGRRVIVGTAEEAFLAGVDRGIVISVVVGILLAALAAWFLARYLLGPVRRLTGASRALAAGDLSHRVESAGPVEVAELADAFNDMADALEQGEVLRRRLVADVAHELRNPIAAVRAQVEGIAEGVLPADEARLSSLVEDVGTLSRLVDELQELSVAEAGRLRYVPEAFDLCRVVQAEVDRAQTLARPGVRVEARCPAEGATVVADPFRMAQVVRNLISNAVRHTGQGSIEAVVSSTPSTARVEVIDTGEGIDDAHLPHIWERFYRADSARSAGTGGTGIGLAIVKRIVEDHGGSVFAASSLGSGSRIGFEVPVAPPGREPLS